MTNSLIPHTFVPGTKARAQEVNANFIALAEEIQSTQNSTTNRFTQVHEEILNTKSEIAENFSDVNFKNAGVYSNVILEAPNGVINYFDQTITVKNGLKVLIPTGLSEEGKFDSIDYTVATDISKTITNMSNIKTVVFLKSNGTIDIVESSKVFYNPVVSAENDSYKFENNKWQKYSAAESLWNDVLVIPVADVIWDSEGYISSVTTYPIRELIIKSDLLNTKRLQSILPEEVDFIVESGNINGIIYKKYKSGRVAIYGYTNAAQSTGFRGVIKTTVTYPFEIKNIYNVTVLASCPYYTATFESTNPTNSVFAFSNIFGSNYYLGYFYWSVEGYLA